MQLASDPPARREHKASPDPRVSLDPRASLERPALRELLRALQAFKDPPESPAQPDLAADLPESPDLPDLRARRASPGLRAHRGPLAFKGPPVSQASLDRSDRQDSQDLPEPQDLPVLKASQVRPAQLVHKAPQEYREQLAHKA